MSKAPVSRARGRPRADEIEQRIAHVLDVAEALIVRDGYQATSVEAIARAAQVSKKTIYSQFENKAGLFAAIVDRLAASRSEGMLADDESAPFEGLLQRAEHILDATFDETGLRLGILMFREGRMFPELGRSLDNSARERFFKPVERYLSACARRGLIRDLDAAFAAKAFFYLLTGDVQIATAQGIMPKMSEAQRKAHARKVCEIFVRGIEAAPAAARIAETA